MATIELDTMDNDSKMTKFLQQKVKLDNGQEGYIFSVVKTDTPKGKINCNVCDVQINSFSQSVEEHASGKGHCKNVQADFFPHEKFPRVMAIETSKHSTDNGGMVVGVPGVELPSVAPGEPVPPGMEDVVTRVPEITSTLDEMKAPLIGLEYLAEITPVLDEVEPKYCCLLCNKRGDPRTVLAHLVCFNHRVKYIGRYFPKSNMALALVPKVRELKRGAAEVLARMVKAIEIKFGRLQPMIVDGKVFDVVKEDIYKDMCNGRHFHESADACYEHMVDMEFIKSCAPETGTLAIDIEKDEAKKRSATMKSQLNFQYKHRQIVMQAKRQMALKAAEKNRGRSKSVETISTLSGSSSRSRSRSFGRRSRSRSGSPAKRYMYRDYKRDPLRRRSRSRSPRFRRRSRSRSLRRTRSRSRTPDLPYTYHRKPRPAVGSYSRSRSDLVRDRERPRDPEREHNFRRRERSYDSPYSRTTERPKSTQMKVAELRNKRLRRDSYRDQIEELEASMTRTLKSYEKNPEKHPLYPEEWKKFWNRRYKELTTEGVDASKHDFKPEWIKFWTTRMKDLHEEELKEKKAAIRTKMGINDTLDVIALEDVVEVSPEPLDEEKPKVTVADIKNTWKALTGTDMKSDPEKTPGFKDGFEDVRPDPSHPIRVITVLRLLAALESQLGSLGPRINDMLSQAISMDKRKEHSSDALIDNQENSVLFETVKEKLKGQLFSGIVEKKMVNATRVAIQNVAEMFNWWHENKDRVVAEAAAPAPAATPAVSAQPLIVPGIGAVDKVAIAQQIATALVAQGKTDVTHEELEQLINAVVGMAQASSGQQTISAAAYAAQVQVTPPDKSQPEQHKPVPPPVTKHPLLQVPTPVGLLPAPALEPKPTPKATPSSLKLIQGYDDPPPRTGRAMTTEDMADLTEDDMKTLLQNFKDLSSEEQQCLITYLKDLEAKEPESVEKLRKFVNFGTEKPEKPAEKPIADPTPTPKSVPAEVKEVRREDYNGRLSPFSMREGGANPMTEERAKAKDTLMDDDDDDDDYSYEDIFRAAEKKVGKVPSKSVVEQMVEEQKTATPKSTPPAEPEARPDTQGGSAKPQADPDTVLSEAKMMIADIMGQLPNKFSGGGPRPGPKTTPSQQDPNTDTPSQQGADTDVEPGPSTTAGHQNESNLLNDYNYQDDIFGGQNENSNTSGSFRSNQPGNSYSQQQDTQSGYIYNSGNHNNEGNNRNQNNQNQNYDGYDNNWNNSNNFRQYPPENNFQNRQQNYNQSSFGGGSQNYNAFNQPPQFSGQYNQPFGGGQQQFGGAQQYGGQPNAYNQQPNYGNQQQGNYNPPNNYNSRFNSNNNYQRYY